MGELNEKAIDAAVSAIDEAKSREAYLPMDAPRMTIRDFVVLSVETYMALTSVSGKEKTDG